MRVHTQTACLCVLCVPRNLLQALVYPRTIENVTYIWSRESCIIVHASHSNSWLKCAACAIDKLTPYYSQITLYLCLSLHPNLNSASYIYFSGIKAVQCLHSTWIYQRLILASKIVRNSCCYYKCKEMNSIKLYYTAYSKNVFLYRV